MTVQHHVPTFDEVAALLRGAARKIGEEIIDPDGDWIPTLIAQDRSGRVLPPVMLAEHFVDDDTKDRLCLALPLAVQELDALRLALIIPTWCSTWAPNADGSRIDPDDRPRASEDPNRSELLTLSVAERGRVVSWLAPVDRTPVGPRLGEWVQSEGEGSGRFPDALRAAFGG